MTADGRSARRDRAAAQPVLFGGSAGDDPGRQPVPVHLGAERRPARVGGNGGAAVDMDDPAVAEAGQMVHRHADAGMVVAADGVHRVADVVAQEAHHGHLAGIRCQLLAD